MPQKILMELKHWTLYFMMNILHQSAFCIIGSSPWWRHQMETFSALLAICVGNSLVPGEFPAQRPVTQSFDVFFDLRLNKSLSKQLWGWWFERILRPLWHHCNVSQSHWSGWFTEKSASDEEAYFIAWAETMPLLMKIPMKMKVFG